MPEKTAKESEKKVESGEQKSNESGGIESNPLREIIYLDIDRVSSYLSQTEDGLHEYQQNIQGGADVETAQSWGFGLGGALPINFNWANGTQIEANTNFVIQQKRRHHAALFGFERMIKRKNLLGSLEAEKPFVELKDHIMLLDYAVLKDLFTRFTDLQYSLDYAGSNPEIERLREAAEAEGQKALKGFDDKVKTARQQTKAKFKKAQEYFDHNATVFREFGNQLDVVIPNQSVIGRLERQYLSVKPEFFSGTYGSPSRKRVAIIALDFEGEADVAQLPAPGAEGAGEGMAYAAAYVMQKFYETLGKTFTKSGLRSIIPIAMYVELEQSSEASSS